MSVTLDRAGIFKARPLSWAVRTFDNSQAVAVNMKFSIVAQLDGAEWVSWADCEEHVVYGSFFVIKKDGTINTQAVENLYAAIGWEGDLRQVAASPVPERIVQITVKAEEYQGKTQYKVAWINPEDYTPTPQGASEDDVSKLQARFGGLLRAAAAGAKRATPAKPANGASKPPPSQPAAAGVGGPRGTLTGTLTNATPTAPNPISGKPEPVDDVPLKGDPPAFDRERTIAGLLEPKARPRVKTAAAVLGYTIAKESDVENMTDAQLMTLSEKVFDDALPF